MVDKATEMRLRRKMKTLTDKSIVITGASSGIGKEILDRISDPEKNNRIFGGFI